MIPLRSPFDGAELALPRPTRPREEPSPAMLARRTCGRGAPIAGRILVVGG